MDRQSQKKRVKDKVVFMIYHSIVDHLVTLRPIVMECHNNKTNILCCFVEFRKTLDTMVKTNLCNILEEFKISLKLRVSMIRLYDNVIANFRNFEG